MKTTIRVLCALFFAGLPLLAQQTAPVPSADPVDALRSPGWNYGFYIGGSQSFANTQTPSTQTMIVGGRLGRVLTHELGSNALRGSLEMDFDAIPLYEFWVGGNAQYAGAINPLIGKWNFTANKSVSPYVAAEGGVVFSPRQLPAPDTSQVNFTSGAEIGLQWFHRPKRSWDFAVKIYHLSNASLGRYNPGINATVQFTVGYTWH